MAIDYRYFREHKDKILSGHTRPVQAPGKKTAKRNGKYNATRIKYDGITFPSKLECAGYIRLKNWKASGFCTLFLRQVPVYFADGRKYVMDFLAYMRNNELLAIDTKGQETQVFKGKMKTLKAEFPEINNRLTLWTREDLREELKTLENLIAAGVAAEGR